MTKAIDDVLAERGEQYGEFKNHAAISQILKDTAKLFPGYTKLSPSQKEALDMIFHKIARAINGNPNYPDNWTDIAGYARLVEQELEKAQSPEEVQNGEPVSTATEDQS